MGQSLKDIRKFLVILSIGILISPSMKVIIGITTTLVGLSCTNPPSHSAL